jgi:hypothetical protein
LQAVAVLETQRQAVAVLVGLLIMQAKQFQAIEQSQLAQAAQVVLQMVRTLFLVLYQLPWAADEETVFLMYQRDRAVQVVAVVANTATRLVQEHQVKVLQVAMVLAISVVAQAVVAVVQAMQALLVSLQVRQAHSHLPLDVVETAALIIRHGAQQLAQVKMFLALVIMQAVVPLGLRVPTF